MSDINSINNWLNSLQQQTQPTNEPKHTQPPTEPKPSITVPPENLPSSYNALCFHKIIDTEKTDFENLLRERTFTRNYDHPDVKHQNRDLNAKHIRMIYKKMITDYVSAIQKYSRLELEKDTQKSNRRLFTRANTNIAGNVFSAAQKLDHCTQLLMQLEEGEKNNNLEDRFELLPPPVETASPIIPSHGKLQPYHPISGTKLALATGVLGAGTTTIALATGILGTNARKFTRRMLFVAAPLAVLSYVGQKQNVGAEISKVRERFEGIIDHLSKAPSEDWIMLS